MPRHIWWNLLGLGPGRTTKRHTSMKRSLLLIAAALALFGQSAPPPKKTPAPKQAQKRQPEPDPEDRWICRIGSDHDCHCPMMMAQAEKDWVAHCKTLGPGYDDCMAHQPSSCDAIQKPSTAHPEWNCKRTCKKMAGCACDEAPICFGPVLPAPDTDDSPEAQQ